MPLHECLCPIRRRSRSLRSIINRCIKQPSSLSNLEELLRTGQGQWSWAPSLRYRRDPFFRNTRSICCRESNPAWFRKTERELLVAAR